MARLSIYIPDDLKARMDGVGDTVNWSEVVRPAIQAAVAAHHGASVHINSIPISGSFAIVRGTSNSVAVHDGVRRTGSNWHVTCSLDAAPPAAAVLQKKCGFSDTAAAELAADDAANDAASKGDFAAASASEHSALVSSTAQTREAEAQRAQLLRNLNDQMNLGQISRPDAIRKWNEMRFSLYFP